MCGAPCNQTRQTLLTLPHPPHGCVACFYYCRPQDNTQDKPGDTAAALRKMICAGCGRACCKVLLHLCHWLLALKQPAALGERCCIHTDVVTAHWNAASVG